MTDLEKKSTHTKINEEKKPKKKSIEVKEAEQRIRRNAELTNTICLENQEQIAEFWRNYVD